MNSTYWTQIATKTITSFAHGNYSISFFHHKYSINLYNIWRRQMWGPKWVLSSMLDEVCGNKGEQWRQLRQDVLRCAIHSRVNSPLLQMTFKRIWNFINLTGSSITFYVIFVTYFLDVELFSGWRKLHDIVGCASYCHSILQFFYTLCI